MERVCKIKINGKEYEKVIAIHICFGLSYVIYLENGEEKVLTFNPLSDEIKINICL